MPLVGPDSVLSYLEARIEALSNTSKHGQFGIDLQDAT
jgi:hypothetical protein